MSFPVRDTDNSSIEVRRELNQSLLDQLQQAPPELPLIDAEISRGALSSREELTGSQWPSARLAGFVIRPQQTPHVQPEQPGVLKQMMAEPKPRELDPAARQRHPFSDRSPIGTSIDGFGVIGRSPERSRRRAGWKVREGLGLIPWILGARSFPAPMLGYHDDAFGVWSGESVVRLDRSFS